MGALKDPGSSKVYNLPSLECRTAPPSACLKITAASPAFKGEEGKDRGQKAHLNSFFLQLEKRNLVPKPHPRNFPSVALARAMSLGCPQRAGGSG